MEVKDKKNKSKHFPYLIAAKRVKPRVPLFNLLTQPALIKFITLNSSSLFTDHFIGQGGVSRITVETSIFFFSVAK